MRIAINAVALRTAGGRSVALNFLKAFKENPQGHQVDAFVPDHCGYEELASPRLVIHSIPASLSQLWRRPYLDRFWLRRRVEALRPDVLFSMANFALPTYARQLVLFHWPYAIYPTSEVWGQMDVHSRIVRRWKLWAFQRRLRYASAVVAQTDVAAERLRDLHGLTDVRVIPNAVSLQDLSQADVRVDPSWSLLFTRGREENDRDLLCLTRYYPHKNLDVLLDLAVLIKHNGGVGGRKVRILTTISADQHTGAKRFLAEVERQRLGEIIVNIGPVAMEHVPALYQATHGLILPTLLESFSGTYVEAMFYKRPVFTSDRDFARAVCGDAAFYFDPHSAESIYQMLHNAFSEEAAIMENVKEGYARVQQFPDWHAVAQQYLDLLEEVAAR